MTVIDEYLNKLDPLQRNELERIRSIVKEVAPNANESISYGIPTFKVNNKPLAHFAAFKDHLSLFPTSKPIEILKDKLTGFTIARGTIHFTPEKRLPKSVIKKLIAIRIKDISH